MLGREPLAASGVVLRATRVLLTARPMIFLALLPMALLLTVRVALNPHLERLLMSGSLMEKTTSIILSLRLAVLALDPEATARGVGRLAAVAVDLHRMMMILTTTASAAEASVASEVVVVVVASARTAVPAVQVARLASPTFKRSSRLRCGRPSVPSSRLSRLQTNSLESSKLLLMRATRARARLHRRCRNNCGRLVILVMSLSGQARIWITHPYVDMRRLFLRTFIVRSFRARMQLLRWLSIVQARRCC